MMSKTKEFLKIIALLSVVVLCGVWIWKSYFVSEAQAQNVDSGSNSTEPPTSTTSDKKAKPPTILSGRPDPLGVNSHSPLVHTATFEVSENSRLQASPCNLGDEEKHAWFWVNTDMVMQCVTVVNACADDPLIAYSCENVNGGRGNTSITVRDNDGTTHVLAARKFNSFAPSGDSYSSLERLFGKGARLRVTIPLPGVDTRGISTRWTLVREESMTSTASAGGGGSAVVVRQVADPGLQKRIDELERLVAQPRVVEVLVDPRPAIETRRAIVLN